MRDIGILILAAKLSFLLIQCNIPVNQKEDKMEVLHFTVS